MTKLPTCREMTQVLSEYLDGKMSPKQARLFEQHLELCPACVAFMESLRGTRLLAREALAEQEVPPEVRAMVGTLLERFRKE